MDIDTECLTDATDRIYGQDPDICKRTRTVIPTTRQNNDFNHRAVGILSIACIFCSFFVYVFEYVTYRLRNTFSFHMYICLHFLQNIVFHFNTRSFVYNISFTHVNFYLGRAFEIFDIPVIVKGFYTQLEIDNRLVVYCSVIYWLINIYLPVTIFWFTCVDKIPRFISIEFTPQYYTVLENWQLCNSVLVFDLLHVYTSIIERLVFVKLKLTCSVFELLCLVFSVICILIFYLVCLFPYLKNLELRRINILSYSLKVSRTVISTICIRLLCTCDNLDFQQLSLSTINLNCLKLTYSKFLLVYIMVLSYVYLFDLQLYYYFKKMEFQRQALIFLKLSCFESTFVLASFVK